MKKLFLVVAIALLVVGLASPAFAVANIVAYGGGTGMGTTKTVTTIMSAANGNDTVDETNIATTVVIPSKCIIIGYSCQVIQAAGADGRFAILDAVAGSAAQSDSDVLILAEAEVTTSIPVNMMFPQGIRISRGLTIKQRPMTAVTVYYIQDRP